MHKQNMQYRNVLLYFEAKHVLIFSPEKYMHVSKKLFIKYLKTAISLFSFLDKKSTLEFLYKSESIISQASCIKFKKNRKLCFCKCSCSCITPLFLTKCQADSKKKIIVDKPSLHFTSERARKIKFI